ncbi:MAG: S-adenosyl-L-homocysteine hydrolase [Pseudomonadota bacterium]
MKPRIFSIGALALTLGGAATGAVASNVCMPAAEMEASLIDWYGETPVDGSDSETTQIWASDQSGTWTLVQYLADGQSCVLAQGSDWGSEVSEDLLIAGLSEQ